MPSDPVVEEEKGLGDIDANDFTLEIDERTARVAGIDVGVVLDQIRQVVAFTGVKFAIHRVDRAGGDAVRQLTIGAADRDHGVTGAKRA